jgi:hypothetical protein
VHKKPLVTQSEYFRNAFKGDFKEAHENSIHLKEEDPAAVALLIGFVYRGVIPGTEKKISPFAQPFISSSREKPTIPNAENIDGTRYPFSTTTLPEENSTQGMRNQVSTKSKTALFSKQHMQKGVSQKLTQTLQFQSICFLPQYSMFSHEELRLADYKVGRQYFDSVVRPTGGLFGSFAGNVQPRPGGLFGGLFGAPQPAQPQQAFAATSLSSQSNSLFGNARPSPYQQNQAAPSQTTSLFGTPHPSQQAQGVSTSSRSTSLFGTPQSQQTASVPTSSSQSNNLFGTPQSASSKQSASVSGTVPTPAQSTQAGGSDTNPTLAQPSQTCNFSLGSSVGGQPTAATSASSSNSSSTSVPSQATVAGPSNTQPPPSTSSDQSGDTTNSTPASAAQNAPPSATHIANHSWSLGLFGPTSNSQTQTQTPATQSLFGNPAPATSQTQQGLPSQNHLAGGSLFPPPPPPATGSNPGGLFGAALPGALWASTWSSPARSFAPPTSSTSEEAPKAPGSFGWTPMIEYPKSPGAFIPGIPRSQPLDAQVTEHQGQQLALLNLCLLAETILWPSLFNAAIEAYVRGEMNLHRPIPPEHVSLIYERTHSASTLRSYVLESMCTNRSDSLMYIDLTRQYDELMEDILNKLPTLRNTTSPAPWNQDDLIRSFHMVDLGTGGKGKEKEDVDISGVFSQNNDAAIQ